MCPFRVRGYIHIKEGESTHMSGVDKSPAIFYVPMKAMVWEESSCVIFAVSVEMMVRERGKKKRKKRFLLLFVFSPAPHD